MSESVEQERKDRRQTSHVAFMEKLLRAEGKLRGSIMLQNQRLGEVEQRSSGHLRKTLLMGTGDEVLEWCRQWKDSGLREKAVEHEV